MQTKSISPSKKICRTIIYDLGANNGDDIPYYLRKADKVIAVEANPILSQEIEDRFPDDIKMAI